MKKTFKNFTLTLMLSLFAVFGSFALSPLVNAGNPIDCESNLSKCDGLISYWKLDDTDATAVDSQGSNDGAISNATSTTLGQVDRALYFNGTDAVVTATSTGLPTGASDRTISFWMKSPDTSLGNIFLVGWGGSANNLMSSIMLGNGDLPSRKIAFWGYGDDLVGLGTLNDNTWYHIAFTLSGTTGTLYINGSSDNTGTLSGLNTSTSSTFYVGYHPEMGNYFNGTIDEITVWDRALDSTEINELYDLGLGARGDVSTSLNINNVNPTFTVDPHEEWDNSTYGDIWDTTYFNYTETGDVGCVDASNCWMSTAGGGFYETTDGGDNWNFKDTSTSESLWNLEVVDANNIWAAGSNNTLLYTNDGGDSFTPQSTGLTGTATIGAVCFYDDSNGTVVNMTGQGATTANGGSTWTPLASTGSGIAKSVCQYGNDADTIMWCDYDGDFGVTTNGGTNWDVTATGLNDCYALYFVSDLVGWVGGDGGRIFKTTDGGTTWGTAQFTKTGYEFWDIDCIDANTCWAAGLHSSWGDPEEGFIVKTTNGGTNWTELSGFPAAQWYYEIDFADAYTGFFTGGGGSVGEASVVRTLTGGTGIQGESSTDYPTNEGTDVVFKTTAHDNNDDQYYLAICATNSITANNSAAPTCAADQTICVSSATDSDSEASCTFDTTGFSSETDDWYAFVCDHNTASACSGSDQGSGDSGSPFHVNHAGTFGTSVVTDTGDSTIEPGDSNMKFLLSSATIADSDSNGVQDTLKMHICTEGTTSFDYPSDTCTGGSLICTSSFTNPTSADADCTGGSDLITVPTAHASYDFKIYVEDNHGLPATGTNTQDYAVQDVVPVLSYYTTNDVPYPPAGGSDIIDYSVALSDDNGDNDVTNVEGVFFFPETQDNDCVADENDCYITACTIDPASVSAPGTGKTAYGSDENLTADCQSTVYFNADPGDWDVNAKATDDNGETVFADAGVALTIPAMHGIDVVETEVAYGTIAIGGTSPAQEITMGNVGNTEMDVLVEGTNMCKGSFADTCTGDYIPLTAQKWNNTSSTFDWDGDATGDGPYPLVAAAGTESGATGCVNNTIRPRDETTDTITDQSVYWKMRIPEGTPTGSYYGEVVFSTSAGCDPEICDNSVDDDGDGRVDCADHHDCDVDPSCSALDLPMLDAQHEDGVRSLDTSANANHAYFYNSPVKRTGPGYELSGSNWLQVADDDSLDITDELTVALWLKINQTPPDYYAVIEKADTNADASYMFYITPTTAKMRPHIYDAQLDDWVYGDTSLSLTPGEWHHFVYTYKSSTGEMRAFVDAEEATISNWYNAPTAGHTIKVSNAPLYIGKDTRGELNLHGAVADVKVYNYAMDLAEVKNTYLELYSEFK